MRGETPSITASPEEVSKLLADVGAEAEAMNRGAKERAEPQITLAADALVAALAHARETLGSGWKKNPRSLAKTVVEHLRAGRGLRPRSG